MEEEKIEYYDPSKMLSYNPLWALILGERSTGKTFAFKKMAINSNDKIFIWLRRRDVERKDVKNWRTFLSDLLMANAIDIDAEYKVNSDGIWKDGIQKVIFSALSTDSGAHSMNYLPDSIGNVNIQSAGKKKMKKAEEPLEEIEERYEKVNEKIDDAMKNNGQFNIQKKIVFEEMLEPKSNYLNKEVDLLMEFYVTVDRFTDTQLFGLANLMSNYNPYFDYFGVVPTSKEFTWYKDKTLLIQNVKLKSHADFVKSRRFYNLVRGTDYGEYLCNNTPWEDDNVFIEKRPNNSYLVYNIRLKNKVYGIWEGENGLFYVSTKHNPEYATFSGLQSMKEDDIPIKKNEGVHRLLSNCMENSILRFDSIPIRNAIYEVVNGGYKYA